VSINASKQNGIGNRTVVCVILVILILVLYLIMTRRSPGGTAILLASRARRQPDHLSSKVEEAAHETFESEKYLGIFP
jgi:hypothetical protein